MTNAIMIVGEAWGREEAQTRKPFVGEAGRLLNKLLRECGIERRKCYVTNVINERPKGNNIEQFFIRNGSSVEHASPLTDEHMLQLARDIERIQPNVIIALGWVALYALTNNTEITYYRGSILNNTLNDFKTKVIPTFHPASALNNRNPLNAFFIKADLKKARKWSTVPGPYVDNRTYRIEPTFNEAIEYLEECANAEYYGSDIEMLPNGEIPCISFALSGDDGMSIPFMRNWNENHFSPPQEAAIIAAIANAYEAPKPAKIFHNVSFDAQVLYHLYGFNFTNLHCTRVAQAILYPDLHTFGDDESERKEDASGQTKALYVVQSLWSDLPYHKSEGSSKQPYGDEYWRYNAKDAMVCADVWPKQINALKRVGNYETYERQMSLCLPFVFNGEYGIRMEQGALNELAARLKRETLMIQANLRRIIGDPEFNPNSHVQKKDYFYNRKRIKPYKHKGSVTINKAALNRLRQKTDNEVATVAQLLLDFSDRSKTLSTYANMKLRADNRMIFLFDMVGTRFGRPSSRKVFGMGGNAQNQTTESKQLMRPEEGYIIYKIDGSQAEKRVVANVSNDRKMLEAFANNTSIHALVAAEMFGGTADPEEQKAHFPTIGLGRHSAYDIGKRTGFASDYGVTGAGLATILGIPMKNGKLAVELYCERFPDATIKHQESLMRQYYDNRTYTNLFNRKYTFYRSPWARVRNNALAYIPQSTVADLTNLVYTYAYYNIDEILLSLIEHDGFYFQLPINIGFERHAAILSRLANLMQRPLTCENGNVFFIPADFTMLPFHFDSRHKTQAFDLQHIDAATLERTYVEATK